MSGLYAQDTTVSSERSRMEIEKTLSKYGAKEFGYMTSGGKALIVFKISNRCVRITLPLPDKSDKRFIPLRNSYKSKQERIDENWEQACRSAWRALNLVIKAKLEAVATGISTVEREFLADVVLPDGRTLGEWTQPQLEHMEKEGRMPKLLPMG